MMKHFPANTAAPVQTLQADAGFLSVAPQLLASRNARLGFERPLPGRRHKSFRPISKTPPKTRAGSARPIPRKLDLMTIQDPGALAQAIAEYEAQSDRSNT